MEIATHPNDLFIQCFELKPEYPGKWYLGISRGIGHNYKRLVTSDDSRGWGDSREETLRMIQAILVGESLCALYESRAPATLEDFVNEARNWGYNDGWIDKWVPFDKEFLKRAYDRLLERGPPIFSNLIDPDRTLNALMIEEIMGRFSKSTVVTVDTSVEPLFCFRGEPTSPPHRLKNWVKFLKKFL